MSKPDDDYLWDGSGDADPDVAKLEQLLRPLAHDRPLDELRMQRAKRRRAPWIVAGIAAIAAAAVLTLGRDRDRGEPARPPVIGSAVTPISTASRCRRSADYATPGRNAR